jgi:DHA1 family inner membrane transport protein
VEAFEPVGTASAGGATTGAVPGRRPVAALGALGALAAAAFCYSVGESLPVGLLPVMSASLHSSLSATGLLVTGYAVVVVVVSAPLTQLTRHIPRRFLLSGLLGVFTLATLASAAAPGYWWLLGARVVAALSQAVFWSIAAVAAAGLFSPQARGRAVAGMYAGGSLAFVLGVPAGTWTGQQLGWRVPFVILAGLGLAAGGTVAVLLPTTKPGESHAAAGTRPDARLYRLLVATTALGVAGTFCALTYVSAFLTRVSGLPSHDIAPVLALSGMCGALGVLSAGALSGQHPALASAGPLAVLTVALLGLYAFGTSSVAAAGLQALEGFSLSALAISLQSRVLVVAPRSTDIASAWYSASFNVGIASGPVIGGFMLSNFGLRSTALAGGILASAALVVALASRAPEEQALRPRSC